MVLIETLLTKNPYLFSSHHADRFASEQVVDKFRNERAAGRENRGEHQLGESLKKAMACQPF